MKKESKALVKLAEQHGYQLTYKNDKFLTYEHACGHRVHIPPSTDERGASAVRRIILAQVGQVPKSNKRNPQGIRERQGKERERLAHEAEASRAELARLRASRSSMLAGRAARLSAELVAIEAHIEREQRNHDELDRLMRQVPASAEHLGRGRARHRSGAE